MERIESGLRRGLIRDTGSHIDRRGLDLYGRLFADPRHVAGALRMMANWDLSKMSDDLRRLKIPLTLVVGLNDRPCRPDRPARSRDRAWRPAHSPQGLGHLARGGAGDRRRTDPGDGQRIRPLKTASGALPPSCYSQAMLTASPSDVL